MAEIKESRKTRYTRMALREGLIELMKLKPIDKITIKELCEAADLNRTTFYAYYKDPYDLLYEIEDEILSLIKSTIAELVGKNRPEMLKRIEGVLQYVVDNDKPLRVLMSEQGDVNFQRQLMSAIYRQVGIMPREFRSGDEAARELYFVFIVQGSVGLIQHWLKNGLDRPAKEIVEVIDNMTVGIR